MYCGFRGFLLVWAFIGAMLVPQAQGQISVPADSQFVFQVDLQAIQRTQLGRKLIDSAKEAAMKELSKQTEKGEIEDPMGTVREALGFDPLEEVQRLVVTASDFEHPEKTMSVWVYMGKTTGNLEGLLLGLPGYERESYGSHDIHSATPDHDRVYGSIHQDGDKNHVLILTHDRSLLEHQLDLLEKKSVNRSEFRTLELDTDRKALVSVQILKFPIEEMGEGPHTNVAKRLRSMSFAINEIDNDIDLQLKLETETDKQAEQIRQMVQGLVAMVEFAKSMESEDEELQKVAEFLKDAKSSVDGSTVKLLLRLPAEAVEKAIREME